MKLFDLCVEHFLPAAWVYLLINAHSAFLGRLIAAKPAEHLRRLIKNGQPLACLRLTSGLPALN